MNCEGCGALVHVHLHACEYCRRYVTHSAPAVNWQAYQQASAQQMANSYNMQWTDPRGIWGSQPSCRLIDEPLQATGSIFDWLFG